MNWDSKTESTIFAAFSAAVIFTCMFVVATAFAAVPSDEVPSETVKFQDLNVASPAGVAALYGRIHRAAQHVCAVQDSRELANVQRANACAAQAEARAVAQLNIAALTAYVQTKNGRQPAALTAGLAK
jgi:UrcA family protein